MQKVIDFFATITKETWQDVVISSISIPLALLLLSKLRTWIIATSPLNLIFKGFRKTKKEILVFLSQLSAVDMQGRPINQPYIAKFPQPLPANQSNMGVKGYQNVDPVWSQSDGRCATEVFNILGRINKHQGFRMANTVIDWNEHEKPIFTIGFNPKTSDLVSSCSPIYFRLATNGESLSIEGHNNSLGARYPDDAGIIQKTFINKTDTPVFILAGLGTTGTEVAGSVLNQNCVEWGKIYGNKPFCALFKTDITRRNYYDMTSLFPRPNLWRALWYPITFIKWYQKKVFPEKNRN